MRNPSDSERIKQEEVGMKREKASTKKECKILVVDDEPLVLSVTASILERMGYPVTTAQGSQEAIALLTGSDYWLVITDFMMPGLNGYQLAAWIKQHHSRTRVVMMTGCSNSEIDEVKASGNIVDAWLYKPIGLNDLRKVISGLELLDEFHIHPVPDTIALKLKTGAFHWHFPRGNGCNPLAPRGENYLH